MSREALEHAILSASPTTGRHVVLIGANQQENLALQYLASALEEAGVSVDIVGFNERADAPRVLQRVQQLKPLLVGVQIAFQYTVEDCLWLVRALREQNYSGHITSGGHVATFCYEQLLAPGSPLDSVVRHEGEATLVELVARLVAGQDLTGILGLVHRVDNDLVISNPRALRLNLDEVAPPRRPQMPYLVAGVPIAFLIASRGCHGSCNYCCINAFTRDAGGPGYRMRSEDAVAEELAILAGRGVRTVFLQDDLFILPNQQAAIGRIERLRVACSRRNVPKLGFWIKGRPESITAPVLQAARELGTIHIFLGIENASKDRLKYMGRTHQPEDAERALSLCAEAGIHPSFNVMLFDPESCLDDVERNLDFMERHAGLPWNFCRTEIYPGTHLFACLSKLHRLQGNYHSWGYRMTDNAAELLFRIVRVSLHERALATTSLQNRLISLAFAWQLHGFLFPGPESSAIAQAAHALGLQVRLDTVAMLRRALEWVRERSAAELQSFPLEANHFAVAEGRAAGMRDFPRHQLADRLWDLLHARGQQYRQWTID